MSIAQFELNMKITELEINSQPSTLPEVREQREVAVKEGIATVDAAMADCTTLFEKTMEVMMILEEDPTM